MLVCWNRYKPSMTVMILSLATVRWPKRVVSIVRGPEYWDWVVGVSRVPSLGSTSR